VVDRVTRRIPGAWLPDPRQAVTMAHLMEMFFGDRFFYGGRCPA
jgi:hypothetical protein